MSRRHWAQCIMNKVLVVFGGNSDEKEISALSAESVLKNISTDYLTRKINLNDLDLNLLDDEIIFIAVHGKGGEDGHLQKSLEEKNIKFTGSRSDATKKCWNKYLSKNILNKNGIKTPDAFFYEEHKTNINEISLSPSKKYFVKPISNGSSLGITKISNINQLEDSITLAQRFSNNVIIEEAYEDAEYTVAILNDKPLAPLEIKVNVPSGYYDYEAKYLSSKTQKKVVSDSRLIQKLKALAIDAYLAHGCSGWGRVDIVSRGEEHAVIEINTVPGFTEKSLFPFAAMQDGISYTDLISTIIRSI